MPSEPENDLPQEIEFHALRVHSAARDAVESLRRIFADSGIESACYALRIRLKDKDRLIEKVQRKKTQKSEYNVYSVTDIIGVRLIALFKAELPELFEKTLKLIQHHEDIRPNPFRKDSLEETILYTNEATAAPFNVLLRTRLQDFGVHCAEEYSKEGYSSLHLVCRLEVGLNSKTDYYIPVEIQIRSVFEDAWGEIDHKYGYSARSGKEPAYNDAQPYISEHLRVLKKFSDACAQYADTIRNMVLTVHGTASDTGKVISVEADGDIIERFSQLSVPPSIIEKYKYGREIRDAAIHAEHREKKEQCVAAANFFKALEEHTLDLPPEYRPNLFLYYVRMNVALCLLSSGAAGLVREALDEYAKITEEFRKFPLARFRLAQACTKVGMYDSAISLFIRVQDEVAEIGRTTAAGATWPDELPKPDFEHVRATLPKLLGYAYWAKATSSAPREPDHAEKLRLIRRAYEVTKGGHTDRPDDIDLVNNLLCYGLDYMLHENQPENYKQLAELRPYAEMLETHCRQSEDIDLLDTLLQWFRASHDYDNALRTAQRIIRQIKHDSQEGDPTVAQVLNRALAVASELHNRT